MPLSPLPVGYKLGSCSVLHVLGQGACGVTYLVGDPRHPEGVAVVKEFLPQELAVRDAGTLQVLPPEPTAEGVEKLRAAQEAFTAEAEALMGLHHRSLVEIVRVFSALGTTYALMECIQGLTVAEWREKNGRPSREQLEYLLDSLLSALRCLHEHGLVHGDLREEHVRFRKDGTPVLLDFGVARQTLSAEGKGSVPTSFKRPSADLFALGAMMRRLLTGGRTNTSGRVVPLAQDSELVAVYGKGLLAGIDKAMNPNEGKGWKSALAWQDSRSGRLLSREAVHRCKLAAGCAAAVVVLGAGGWWAVDAISQRVAEELVVPLTPEQQAEAAFAKARYMLEEAPAVLAPDGTVLEPARPDKEKSLACLLEAAELGHPEAPWKLVSYYTEGIGCEPDPAEVFRWCEVAARQENVEAQYLLARLYRESKGTPTDDQAANDAAAIPYLKAAAAAGIRDAQFELAQCYVEAKGLYADPEEAVRWFTAAGEQGDVRARMELGRRYKEADGVVMNHQESFRWYSLAAEAGVPEAWYRLGLAHLEGSGTPRNTAEGADCLRKAAEQGMVEAQYRLGHDIVEGLIPEASAEEAAACLKRAADQGMVSAQWELAEFYAKGKGGGKDAAAAYPYYLKAAEAGNVAATLALAEAALSGHRDLPCDTETLRALLGKAVESGEPLAMLYAGLMCDRASAERKDMLQKAADAGSADALAYLGWMQGNPARAEELYRAAADKHSAFGEAMTDYCILRNGAEGEEAASALSGLQRDAAQESLYHGYTLAALAEVYLKGWGTDKDVPAGMDCLKKASDAGNLQATCQLAQAYEEGALVERDAARAMELYRIAAEAGSTAAAYSLAVLCDKAEDKAQAAGWFRKAAEAGHPAALFHMARIAEDKDAAQNFYRRAAEAGHVPAMPFLSRMYEVGEGVEADPEQAFYWAHRATEEGADGAAWDQLAGLYNAGIGVTRDEKEALRCWEKAAKDNNPAGMYHYGLALYTAANGLKDSSANKKAGRTYLVKAATAGHEEAVAFVQQHKLNEPAKPTQTATPSRTTPRTPSRGSSRPRSGRRR